MIRYQPTVAIDVETTGLDEAADRVLEIALLVLKPSSAGLGGETRVLRFMLEVGATLSPGSWAVLGSRYDGSAAATPFKSIAEVLHGHLHGARWLGHNLHFDLRFLVAEFMRAGTSAPHPTELIDTVGLCRAAFPDLVSLSIAACCERAGVQAPATLAPSESVVAIRLLAAALEQRPPADEA